MNKILQEDIAAFTLTDEMRGELTGKKMIVTGATGLVGSLLVKTLSAKNLGIRFILPVRDRAKAKIIFGENSSIDIRKGELSGFFDSLEERADYVVHCASPTNGKYMSEHPAETYLLAIESTKAILEYCRRMDIKGCVYLSSIEYYGQIFNDFPVTEDMNGLVDYSSPRSSYSLGKQGAEYLCYCYAKEYGVPVCSARLTQTFGAGISKDDPRVFAQFARSALAGEDIILHTAGNSAKPYCYTMDTLSAILYILLKGEKGEAYNVATPGTYCSILEFARKFRECLAPQIAIKTEIRENTGYAPETRVNLNADKLMGLGWEPRYDLPGMITRLGAYLSI